MKKFPLTFVMTLSLLCLILGCTVQESNLMQKETYDILIKGGTIIDGSGAQGYIADVLVQGEIISKIGRVDENTISVKQVIDARGKVVTPGFIDHHAHGNPLKTPEFNNFSGMGVTTILLGQDGDSSDDLARWMEKVDSTKTGINIGTFVGHGTIRNQAGVKLNPDPSQEDLEKMAKLVEQAMELGCFGLSTGLEYQPGSFSGQKELIAIAVPVGENHGLVSSHTRNEDDDAIQESIAELIAQGQGGHCPINISHMKVVYGHGAARAEEILLQMEEARQTGISITADMYPYQASYTGIGIVFPAWAKPPFKYDEVVKTRRSDLATYLRDRVNRRNGPAATLLGTAPWAGKTLAQIATELDKPFEDVLIDDIGPRGASGAYFVMDQELQDRLFIDPHIMVCSDGSPTMRHPRGYGSFAKIIRYYVREKKLLELEEAIYKMTGLPARTLGLDSQKRGLIQTDFAADMLIFDPERIMDKATFEAPHQISEGFDWVLVNGIPVRAEGSFTGQLGGKMLRKHHKGMKL